MGEVLNVHFRWFNKVRLIAVFLVCLFLQLNVKSTAQTPDSGKKISSDLFGLFFEDINYSADGGLYAEMVQNRSFEYNPTERKEWTPFSYWEYITPGFSFGAISVETTSPIHPNNTHYIVLTIEHVGKEAQHKGDSGVGIKNSGFEGMLIKSGERYSLSIFAKRLSKNPISITASLQSPDGKLLGESKFSVTSENWEKYSTSIMAKESNDSARLVVLATTIGKMAIDVVSLFPEKTFKNRTNGLRADLAQKLADMTPRFVRFPGGCLVHGDGLANMYRWKNTIGPIEERKEQRNLWGYHQTAGLGYFEYFQFCEDIGAKPLPVLPAAVSCQNSGGTWRIGGTGQKALPIEEMEEYIQEVLDLIEWANGPADSEWGAKRAAAGHSAPFNLEYIGIGNEDKITTEFEERFKMINNAVKARHPEITIIGTVGPFYEGEDFEKGWKIAKELNLPIVDEHYYCGPEWFLSNTHRYDSYERGKTQVYLGEYASWGNKVINAIAEAAYMTSLERNGDVVKMASYAPLLAKKDFIQWKTDMIFFDNVNIVPTVNYHVQKMFMTNQGDIYFDKVIKTGLTDSTLFSSCVMDSKTDDVIIKMVNSGNSSGTFKIDLSKFKNIKMSAEQTVISGGAEDENTFEKPHAIEPVKSVISISKKFEYSASGMSVTVLRIKKKKVFKYTNPITRDTTISMRDHYIIKVGDLWYCTGTSNPVWTGFNPGVRLLVSSDLINWEQHSWLIDATKLADDCPYKGRFWAPEIHYIKNKFWLTVNSGRVTADDPKGMKTHSVWLFVSDEVIGPYKLVNGPLTPQYNNDATLFEDEDGQTYLYCSGNGLFQAKIDLNSGKLIGSIEKFLDKKEAGYPDWMVGGIEGPFVVKRDGTYFMFFSTWTRGYEVGLLKSKNPLGPWELVSKETIFGTRKKGYRPELAVEGGYSHLKFQDTEDPYCETGHNALFIGPDGNLWNSCHYTMYEKRQFPHKSSLHDWEKTPQMGIEPVYFEGGRFFIKGPTWTEQIFEY